MARQTQMTDPAIRTGRSSHSSRRNSNDAQRPTRSGHPPLPGTASLSRIRSCERSRERALLHGGELRAYCDGSACGSPGRLKAGPNGSVALPRFGRFLVICDDRL